VTYIPPKKYFFSQDYSSHWYMVPVELRETWNKYTINDLEDYDEIEEFERIFGQYSTGGDISHIEFSID
jgi:hypothetical protein